MRTPVALATPALALVLLATSACGYELVGSGGSPGPDAQRIAIRMFENRSVEPGLERMFADAFQEEFLRRGQLVTLLGARPEAELELRGVIREVLVSASALSSVALTLEEEVIVIVDLSIQRRSETEFVLSHRDLRYDERFLASPDPQVYESNKEQALRRLSSALASRIHDELYQAY